VEVAPETAESAGPGLSPETLLERLGFPRSQQHKEVRRDRVCVLCISNPNLTRKLPACLRANLHVELRHLHAVSCAFLPLSHQRVEVVGGCGPVDSSVQLQNPQTFVQVGLLSGGQRRRLQLAGVLRRRPNLLLLDEATNDLDISTIEARPPSSRTEIASEEPNM